MVHPRPGRPALHQPLNAPQPEQPALTRARIAGTGARTPNPSSPRTRARIAGTSARPRPERPALDDDVLQIARSLAKSRRISLGQALSQLARKGLQPAALASGNSLFPSFPCRPDDPLVTAEQVRDALEEW